MTRLLALAGILGFGLALTGCSGAMVGFQPSLFTAGPGIIFTDVQGGSLVVENVTPSKTGTACSTQILGVVATGDTRVETAMNNGGVRKLSFVSQSIKSYVFGVYSEVCTIARGN